MVQPSTEYRYSPAAVGRSRLFFAASLALLLVLVAVLVLGWQTVTPLAKIVGFGLLLVMLATARAQLARIGFRLRILPERLEVLAPLAGRSIAWSEIAEVRRIATPRMFGPPVWVCAVSLRSRRGGATAPVFIFDSGLERAEQAFRDITARSGVEELGKQPA